MSNVLGSLVVEMAVNLGKLRSDFGQAAQISQTRLREIERSTATTMRQISNVGRTIQSAFATIGVGVGITSLIYGLRTAATEAIRYGDEIEKAAAKTGLGASQFATLAEAAKLADVDVESLSKGLRALQVNISKAASGEKGPAELFRALGIEIEKFQSLDADRQLELLADQIRALPTPADQARAGVQAFGRAWDTLAPLVLQGAEGIRKAREEIEKLGGALTDQQIKALADADQAIKQLTFSWNQFSRVLTGDVAPGLVRVIDLIRDLSQVKLGDVVSTLLREGPTASWRDLARTVEERAGREQVQRALAPGLNAELMQRGIEQTRPAISAPPGFGAAGGTARAGGRSAVEQGLQDVNIYTERMWNLQNEIEDAISMLNEETTSEVANMMATVGESTNAMMQDIAEAARAPKEAFSELTPYAEQAARNIQDAFARWLFDPFEEGVRGMLAGFVDAIRQMLAQYVAMQAITGLGSMLSGSSNPLVAGIGTFLSGKAGGGAVAGGMPYLVGERGPELFVPRSSGTIVPNNAMGGAVTVNYAIDARGADAERILAIMPGLLKATEQRTIAAMKQMQRQGRFA